MRHPSALQTRPSAPILMGIAALGSALLGACAGSTGSDEGAEPTLASRAEALIGGSLAGPDQFRTTVGFADVCTAAKVGPRLFLTAAHCVAVPRPGRLC